MGSFADTCCISGLPIEVGDEVRYLLLTENPYFDGSFVCYPYGRWVPRTWPIKAKYNDYGSIEDWEENAVQHSFLEGLKVDMVEVGVGDNSIHDVATSKDMSFGQMLEAVLQGSIIVDSEPEREERNARMQNFLKESDKRNGDQRIDPISEWKPSRKLYPDTHGPFRILHEDHPSEHEPNNPFHLRGSDSLRESRCQR